MIQLMPAEQASALQRLDLHLDLPTEIPELETLLYETVLAGGKRFRPALCLLMGGVFGVPSKDAAPYARVAELMHAATLAHDDVIDEAQLRRNRPTLNAIATNQKAVLTGDLLLARVVNEIAMLGNLAILRDGAQVLEDLVRGEWLQIHRRGTAHVTREMLERASDKKTSSLIAWCCTTPARLAGATPALIDRAARFGARVGLSFQMADDILDLTPGGEKPYANDLQEGLINFVVLEMIEADPALVPRLQAQLDRAPGAALEFPWTETQLAQAKATVRQRVRSVIAEAQKDLQEIADLVPTPRDARESSIEALDTILSLLAERLV